MGFSLRDPEQENIRTALLKWLVSTVSSGGPHVGALVSGPYTQLRGPGLSLGLKKSEFGGR